MNSIRHVIVDRRFLFTDSDKNELLTTGGQSNAFDKSSKYKVRILEISGKGLKTLEVAEGDTWDSGFAVERIFTSQNL
jgi:hypothetical protein